MRADGDMGRGLLPVGSSVITYATLYLFTLDSAVDKDLKLRALLDRLQGGRAPKRGGNLGFST